MKLFLIISDSHGDKNTIKRICDLYPMASSIIHLGDYYKDALFLINSFPEKDIYIVPGNCDMNNDSPGELLLEEEGIRILLTHGHRYDVKSGLGRLKKKASADKLGVVAFGHTHKSMIEKEPHCIYINPGSCSYPRGVDIPTFALLEVDKGRAEARILEVI